MALTRILNNQITDSVLGNTYVGVNAAAKVQEYSVTAGKLANNITYDSSLTITGNLTVQGNTTSIDTVNLVVEDPIIILASEQTGSPAVDIGFIGQRGTEDNIAWFWDESADEFAAAFTTDLVTNTTVSINSYASVHVLDITARDANISGNVTFNGIITGNVDVTGNLTAGNIISDDLVQGVTITASGNLEGNNAVITNDVGAATVTATGNVSGGNLITAGNVDGANVNAVSGVTAGTTIVATGNVSGGNLTTAGNIDGANVNATAGITAGTTIVATGNVSGGNVTTAGLTSTATLSASGNANVGNLGTAGLIVATGNVTGGNINTAGQVVATGNITGGNLITTGVTQTGTLETTGNALIGGNLVVQGNITYINIDDLRVEDPIIILGTGPNGAPLTVNDGRDRGIYMEYYTTGLGNAFVGWQNTSGNIIIANDVEFSGNDVVQVNAFGTLEVGNIYAESIVSQGNVSGGNLTTAGNIDGANVNATSGITAGTTIVATGNVSGGNITTAGLVVATGNVTGGNITTAGQVTATGNITGGNLTTAGLTSTATLSASGNANVGNLGTAGLIVATGNITGGNLTTAGLTSTATLSASGNANVGNLGTAGLIVATGNVTGGNLITQGAADLGNIRITGNDITNFASNIITINDAASDIDVRISGDTVANLLVTDAGTDTVVIGSGNATVGAALKVDTTDSMIPPVGNLAQRPGTPVVGMLRFSTTEDALEVYTTGAGWETVGVPAFTVITADEFIGNGACTEFTLSSNSTTAATIVSINGVVQIPTTAYSVSGNVITFTEAPEVSDAIDARVLTTTTTVTAIRNTSGNAEIAALDSADTVQITGNLLPAANITYNLGSNTVRWNDLYLANSTIYLGNAQISANATAITLTDPDGNATVIGGASASISVAEIIKVGSNGVGNIGSASSAFDTVFAKATSAQYADLAEMYEADAEYAPGTVLCFGGAKEVTLCGQADSTRVAGVVSTNPSYLMNSGQSGEYVAAVALTGRVPCRVTGTIRKGDLIVSTGDGRGRANNAAKVGTVIGKALADFDGSDGMIEVVVGRV